MFGTSVLRPDDMCALSKSTFSFNKSEEQSFQNHNTLREINYFFHLAETETTGLGSANV